MKAFVVFTLVALGASSAMAKAFNLTVTPIAPGFLTDKYDCTGKTNGDYFHYDDCYRFISCSNALAYDMPCAECHVNAKNCPDGKLVFNEDKDQCLFYDETECRGRTEEPTTAEPTTAKPTTSEPTPEPTEDTPETEATEDTEAPTTTETPTTTEEGVTSPPSDCCRAAQLPTPGSTCDPLDCKRQGCCHTYVQCDKDTKVWVKETCGKLLWNPAKTPEQGGDCDWHKNIDKDLRTCYENDKDCLECFWNEIDSCTNAFWYQAKGGHYYNPQLKRCAEGLVFDLATKACKLCSDAGCTNARDETGAAATCAPEPAV